jgi:phytoene dehydrogenase-like protein
VQKSVIIIGAGIAGLAAGCYAQMNGYRSQVFEMHHLPGGLCTAWERKGYTFDGCIHYLFGTGPGKPFHQVWQELGVAQDCRFVNHSELMRVQDMQGRTLVAYCDPDKLEAHMKEISPADAKLIEAMCQGIRRFTAFDMSLTLRKPKALMSSQDWAAMGREVLPYLLPMAKWGRISAKDYAERFQDPFLRRAVAQMFTWPDIPLMVGLSLLASLHIENAGVPLGGSLQVARAVERRYLELGGEIYYRSQVERILVEDGDGHGDAAKRAIGVRLYDDSVHHADYVISTADGRGTIFDMLGGDFVDKRIKDLYDGDLPMHSQLQISLGVDRDLSGQPHWTMFLLDEPIVIAGEPRYEIGIKTYSFDPSLAPDGRSVLIAMMTTHYGYWQRIYGRRLYDTEQIQVNDQIIGFLNTLYPGVSAQIEVKDVATPLSYERFTGNWQGSSCGWLLTKDTMGLMIRGMDKTLPGLGNLYLAGQWVEPGGSVPVVAMSGRNAIQLLCHQDGRAFVTEVGG